MEVRVEVQTMSHIAYEHLHKMILTGGFRPGQWIKERELTDMLGISRTPLREALRMLERERFIVSIPHRGFRLPVPTVKELQDFYELRAELEGMAARLAAERASNEDLQHLSAVWAEAELGLKHQDASIMAERNDEFHLFLAMCTGNQELVASLRRLKAGIDLYRNLSWSAQKARPAKTLEQHQLILAQVRTRNGKSAQDTAHQHILDSLTLAIQGLESVATGIPGKGLDQDGDPD